MTAPGAIVAEGRTSVVLAYGSGSVVKVPRPGVPPHWARVEAELTEAVHRAGLACPEVRGLVEIDDRESIVFQRVDGPSLWDLIRDDPGTIDRWAAVLVDLQCSMHRVGALPSLPRLEHRLLSKVLAADGLSDVDRSEASRLAAELGNGSSLCHGDLHPANVLMSDAGPVVIDWFDASIGAATADVVRTSLLLRAPSRRQVVPTHLPRATPEILTDLHRRYIERAVPMLASNTDRVPSLGLADELLAWERALAAGRLAEHTTADRADLVALLGASGRPGRRSVLGEALRGLGLTEEV